MQKREEFREREKRLARTLPLPPWDHGGLSDVMGPDHLFDGADRTLCKGLGSGQIPIRKAEDLVIGLFIVDNLSLFYYRYIFRFLSQRNVLDEDLFYERYIHEDFETQYVPRIFETICKQYLIRQNRAGKIDPAFDRIGKYYYDDPKTRTNGEFDTVTQDPTGYIFYESKFRKEPLSLAMIREEIQQVQATGLNCYRYGFFSRSGFQCEPTEKTVFIRLDELYQ